MSLSQNLYKDSIRFKRNLQRSNYQSILKLLNSIIHKSVRIALRTIRTINRSTHKKAIMFIRNNYPRTKANKLSNALSSGKSARSPPH